MCSYNDGGICINPKCGQYEDFCKSVCDRRDEKTRVRKARKTEKLYKVFISYRQPYKTRRWLLFSADSMEEAVARLQLVAKTGIVSYVRIERREP